MNPAAPALPFTGERFVPEAVGDIALEHLHRYLMAGALVEGRRVLDIACGEGYGSALLARSARHVTGVDIDAAVIAHASARYTAGNLAFAAGSCAAIPLPDASVEVVVSFETIEHHDQHEAMLREFRRVLVPGGLLVISSPDKAEYSDKTGYANPFHVRELYRDEFTALLARHFRHQRIAGQRVVSGSAILAEDGPMRAASFTAGSVPGSPAPGVARPWYLIALASDAALPEFVGGLFAAPPASKAPPADPLAAAASAELSDPAEAARLYAAVLAAHPANLDAHNALERLEAPGRAGEWMRVGCVIDPRDDIYRFFAAHPQARNPIREYLSDGWRTLSELMLLLESLQRPLLGFRSVLEFGAGFGRFTRHLARAMPGRVTCAEILPGSREFLQAQFGVAVCESAHDPAALRLAPRHDLVFALSVFTHLPPRLWGPWLQCLCAALAPGGLLVLSVHNEAFARASGVVFQPDGTCFLPSSESTALDGATYGTTFTTRDAAIAAVVRALAATPYFLLEYRSGVFWVGQDAIVIGA